LPTNTIPFVIWLIDTDRIILLIYTDEITNGIYRFLTKYDVQQNWYSSPYDKEWFWEVRYEFVITK
jgi:hypothetical protein